jgi:hypothetical protein
LDKQETPSLPQEITSLDIAKYLYRVMEKNSSFKNRISSLMPEKKWVGDDGQKSRILKTEDNYPEYYGMLELACRLNGILTGERFQ